MIATSQWGKTCDFLLSLSLSLLSLFNLPPQSRIFVDYSTVHFDVSHENPIWKSINIHQIWQDSNRVCWRIPQLQMVFPWLGLITREGNTLLMMIISFYRHSGSIHISSFNSHDIPSRSVFSHVPKLHSAMFSQEKTIISLQIDDLQGKKQCFQYCNLW